MGRVPVPVPLDSVVDKGWHQLALPYHNYLPPVLLIPSAVTVDFGLPEADVAFQYTGGG